MKGLKYDWSRVQFITPNDTPVIMIAVLTEANRYTAPDVLCSRKHGKLKRSTAGSVLSIANFKVLLIVIVLLFRG